MRQAPDLLRNEAQSAESQVAKRRFLLVGQPCDIALRSDSKHDLETAYLIPIRVMTYEAAAAAEGKRKEHHPMYIYQVKAPSESKGDYDFYKLISTIPEEKAFRPISEGGCPLVDQRDPLVSQGH